MATAPTPSVLAAIAQVGRVRARPIVAPPDDLDALMAHVVAVHHEATRELLGALAVLAEALAGDGRAPRLPAAVADLDAILVTHLAKEERVLFAYLHGLAAPARPRAPFASLDAPLRVLVHEHAAAHAAVAALIDATRPVVATDLDDVAGALADAVAALADDLARHTQLEESVLFPAARRRELAATSHPQELP